MAAHVRRLARSRPALTGSLAATVTAFVVSVVLTEVVRRIALRRGMLDVPDHRSAHTVPRPRGGGAAIVVAVPAALVAAVLAGARIDDRYWYAIGLATLLSVIGMADDVYRLDYRPRLLAQIAAAILLLALVGSVTAVVIPGFAGPIAIELSTFVGIALTVVGLVGFTNAFNFMDGIDGIAAAQAVVGGAVLAAMQPTSGGAVTALAIAAASGGFLLHNSAPARVFLGDTGSQYLGFLLGAVAVTGEQVASVPASLAALVFLPFVLDAGLTLAGRVRRGERWHEPHRQHAYQRLVAAGWSHGQTTALYAALAMASGVVIAVMQRSVAIGWLWWLVLFGIVVMLRRMPPPEGHAMLRR